MGFNQTQRVIDACALAKELGGEWGFLLWLARHCDQDTGRITRSQVRLASELGVTDRQVRNHLRAWRERGVVQIIEHGGGRHRKPSVMMLSMRALEDFTVKQAYANRTAPPTQEAHGLPVLNGIQAMRKQLTSGVDETTPEPMRFRS